MRWTHSGLLFFRRDSLVQTVLCVSWLTTPLTDIPAVLMEQLT